MLGKVIQTAWIISVVQVLAWMILEYTVKDTDVKEASTYLLITWAILYVFVSNLIGFYVSIVIMPIIESRL